MFTLKIYSDNPQQVAETLNLIALLPQFNNISHEIGKCCNGVQYQFQFGNPPDVDDEDDFPPSEHQEQMVTKFGYTGKGKTILVKQLLDEKNVPFLEIPSIDPWCDLQGIPQRMGDK